MDRYILPAQYLIYSRLKSKLAILSWVVIYMIPLYSYVYIFCNDRFGIVFVLLMLSFMAFYSLYDLGYIYNDVFTTQKEEYPNFRIDKQVRILLLKEYPKIVLFKILLFAGFVWVAYLIAKWYNVSIYLSQYMMIVFLVGFFFGLHNVIRNRFNIVTFALLSWFKYIAPLFLIVSYVDIGLFLWLSFLIFPMVRVIEHATKTKYGLTKWQKIIRSHDAFRVKYYLVLTIVCIILAFKQVEYSYFLLGLAIYFFVYRVLIYLMIHFKFYKRKA